MIDSEATHKTKAVGRQQREDNIKNEIMPTSFDENDDTDKYYCYWKELYAILSSFGLVFLSYAILLYLLSYEKSECPSPPIVTASSS
jgi:hypothetical protein